MRDSSITERKPTYKSSSLRIVAFVFFLGKLKLIGFARDVLSLAIIEDWSDTADELVVSMLYMCRLEKIWSISLLLMCWYTRSYEAKKELNKGSFSLHLISGEV